MTSTRTLAPRATALSAAALLLIAACGGGSTPTATNGPGSTATAGGNATSTLGGGEPTSTPGGGEQTPAGETGTLRFVNLYLDESGNPEDIVLFANGQEDDGVAPITTVGYGPTSGYVDVTTDSSLRMYAAAHIDDQHSQFATDLSGYDPGDSATIVLYTAPADSSGRMGMIRIEEKGASPFEFWPEIPSGKALAMIFPGALQSQPEDARSWWYNTSEDECLIDATTGQPQEFGFGGNVPQFFQLDPGTTEVQAADSCGGEASIPAVTINAEAGQRWLIMPYADESGELTFLGLELAGE